MKDERLIKVKKQHECNFCELPIIKGESAYFYEGKAPKLDTNGKQIGIEYWKIWMHTFRCDLTTEERDGCAAGKHQFEPEKEFDHYAGFNAVYLSTGFEICSACGLKINDEF